MNIPLTGLADLFSESYKYYKISNYIKNENIIIEKGEAERNHAKAKAKIGALQWVILGLVAGLNKESHNVDITSALGLGLVASFAGVAVVANIASYASLLLEDDAKNYKAFHGEILKNNELYNTSKNETELSINDSYRLFMIGNSVTTGNTLDKIAFKMKKYISMIKAKWETKDIEEFNETKNIFVKFIKKHDSINEMLKKFVKDESLKTKANQIIFAHTNYQSPENELFRKYIIAKYPTEQRHPESYNAKLKEINKDSILSAYEIIRTQNVELFFAKIVLDYNKGIIHKDIIDQFAELHDKTKFPEKGDNKGVDVESYKNISKIAFQMKCGIKVYSKNTDVKVVLNHINPKLVNDKKIIIHSFNDIFENEKRKEIEKKMDINVLDSTAKNINKINYNEIEIDNRSFNEIVKITEKKLNQEKKTAEKIKEANKNKI